MTELSAHAGAEATLADAEATRAAARSVDEDGAAIRREQYALVGLGSLTLVLAAALVVLGHPVPAAAFGLLGAGAGVGVMVRPVNAERWRPRFDKG